MSCANPYFEFRGVDELVAAVENYIEKHNEKPKPYLWTSTAFDILEKVKPLAALSIIDSLFDAVH